MQISYFHAHFDVSGEKRIQLVKAISEIMGVKEKYLGTKGDLYEIDYITVTPDGMVSFDDRADSREIENLFEKLKSYGFISESPKNGSYDDLLKE